MIVNNKKSLAIGFYMRIDIHYIERKNATPNDIFFQYTWKKNIFFDMFLGLFVCQSNLWT